MDDVETSRAGTEAIERWQASRAGLINLWRYWDETFVFHRGRLLLRGPNGSGKSMALELLLPFLLDADASQARLSTATKSRGTLYERMMSGSDDATRAGFVWIEFRRGKEVFTAGVRLRASKSTHKVDPSFFTTSQAIGDELELLDQRREPLSRKALEDAIGSRGAVHPSGAEHRKAVRETLFPDFSPERYDSVITALLALRKEKLSQNLDANKLSSVLTEALPPLDEHDLAVVAEGFERLDRRRAELDGLKKELEEVRMLRQRQRAYARAIVAHLASEVRSAETRRDAVTRKEREAKTALAGAEAEAKAVEDQARERTDRHRDVLAEIEALRDSDGYREGVALEDLRKELRRLTQLVEREVGDVQTREGEKHSAESDAADTREQRDTAAAAVDTAAAYLRKVTGDLGAGMLADEATSGSADEGERIIDAWVRAHRDAIAEVSRLLDKHRDAVSRRDAANAEVDLAISVEEQRRQELADARRALSQAVDTFVADVRAWVDSCTTIGPDRVAVVLPDPPDAPHEVTRSLARLATAIVSEYAVAHHDLVAAKEAVVEERAGLVRERKRLEAGAVVEPQAPAWRSDRADRIGAPLWRLVDVCPDAAPSDLDGIEAALHASGLLDAWVFPGGSMELPEGAADLVLHSRSTHGQTLGDFLVPVEHAGVDAARVTALLASVPVAASIEDSAHDVVVAVDGTFRLGAAEGRGPVRPAEFLGAAAREKRRLVQLAEIGEAIAARDQRTAELVHEIAQLDKQRKAAVAELAAVPGGELVVAASERVAKASTRSSDAIAELAKRRRALSAAEEAVRKAYQTLTARCAHHGLPTQRERLDEVNRSVAALERAGRSWARERRALDVAQRDFDRAQRHEQEAIRRWRQAKERLDVARTDESSVKVRLQTLEATFGVEYRQLVARIGTLETERKSVESALRELNQRLPQIQRRVGSLEADLARAEADRASADEARERTHERFDAGIRGGLLDDVGIDAPPPFDGVTAVLVAARDLGSKLQRVQFNKEAIERASASVEERLHHVRAALGGRVDLARERAEQGWWSLRAATAGGLRRSVSALAEVLDAELQAGRSELAADEERLFEQTLAGSVRQALADRIRLATDLVKRINDQLSAVKTAAGRVEVRLRWDVDEEQPDAVKAARALLLRDPATLSDTQRAALQAFVRARVDQARAELEVNAPWEARLRETLDYRAWHRFTMLLGHRDWEGLKEATPKRLQRLSTGERSIALHLPMLASLAAHYANDEGEPSGCPRLILLDELFVGVDAANRAQLFGTFTAWQMGAVFTSDHEWCQYETLDGIAIHHLHPAVGDGPVTSTRFTWDGRQRVADMNAD